jgi:hypothetical protein
MKSGMSRMQGRCCNVCGNEVSPYENGCPYCGGPVSGSKKDRSKRKTINLEKGLPLTAEAVRKLKTELVTAKRQGIKVLTIIHGYGASGTGGEIKSAVRRFIESNHPGLIRYHVAGDKLPLSSADFNRIPADIKDLKSYADLHHHNPGITIVFL